MFVTYSRAVPTAVISTFALIMIGLPVPIDRLELSESPASLFGLCKVVATSRVLPKHTTPMICQAPLCVDRKGRRMNIRNQCPSCLQYIHQDCCEREGGNRFGDCTRCIADPCWWFRSFHIYFQCLYVNVRYLALEE
jgi:hypothetical protein